MKFDRNFYLNDTLEIAENLLGSLLCTNTNNEFVSGRIVEVEAYFGVIDKASHSYGGRRTKRTEAMYSPGGVAYIYLIYGLHSLFNVVTGMERVPHAILVRALEPVDGIDIMKNRRKTENLLNLTSGPGKLCSALNLSREHSGIDLTGDKVWIERPDEPLADGNVIHARRIGIDYAEEYKDKLWRFYIKDNPHISKKLPESLLRNNREILPGT